jgi:hypothetical protein
VSLIAPGILDLASGIDLANVDALEELEFNVDSIHSIAYVLQTVTSSRLAAIVLDPNGNHHNYPNMWRQLDTVLYALVDHTQSVRGPQADGSHLHMKLFLRSNAVGCDFVEFANQLLPKCAGRGCVTVFGAILEGPGAELKYSMY